MKYFPRILAALLILGFGAILLAMQRGRFQRGRFQDDEQLLQSAEKNEYAFARLRYDGYEGPGACFGYSKWTTDYPKADRQFMQGVRRLTRLDNRMIEQVVDPDSDELFNWPWLYAVEVGTWNLTPAQAEKLREYLLRGGFLMVDDFHGTFEWSVFVRSMQRVFPDRPIVDLADDDQILHTLWDMTNRFQVPGAQFLYSGRTYEDDGVTPRWRAIYDDQGRIMVAICHNMDLGDAVEHSDTAEYPEEYSATAMRTFLNYIVYAMTH